MSAFAGYSTRQVAELLGVSPRRIYAYLRLGALEPRRGRRRELRFSFQDLVLLRSVQGLVAAGVPGRRIRQALAGLRRQLPRGRPLSSLRLTVEEQQIVVRDGDDLWEAESGQGRIDFQIAELAAEVAPLARRAAAAAWQRQEELSGEDWFELGCELEAAAPEEARRAYLKALAIDPRHADAHLNLGRLLHQAAELAAAERHYRQALAARPDDATGRFNLGVVLEDLGRPEQAAAAYRRALGLDPACADAHYNLAGLAERAGDRQAALRHLKAYKRLAG